MRNCWAGELNEGFWDTLCSDVDHIYKKIKGHFISEQFIIDGVCIIWQCWNYVPSKTDTYGEGFEEKKKKAFQKWNKIETILQFSKEHRIFQLAQKKNNTMRSLGQFPAWYIWQNRQL